MYVTSCRACCLPRVGRAPPCLPLPLLLLLVVCVVVVVVVVMVLLFLLPVVVVVVGNWDGVRHGERDERQPCDLATNRQAATAM